MQKIIPHLWFDKDVKKAIELYTSVFPGSKINSVNTIKDTPSGDCDIISFRIMDLEFMAIGAGPEFKFTPAFSFLINFDPSQNPNAETDIQKVWDGISEGGEALMPVGEYPFAKKYGWIKDKYGLTWQLMLTNPDGEPRPQVIPFMTFVQGNAGKAAEARDYYISIFKNSKKGSEMKYPDGMDPEKEGNLMFADFMLENQWFAIMESANEGHKFNFNESVSLMVNCKDQEEIDFFWEKLSAVPESEQCGWLKDKYGVSWQIIPENMREFMTPETTQAFLKMKKIDINELKRIKEGK